MDTGGQQAENDASDAGRALGRLGATKGGRARASALTPAERSEIARRAVQARWARSNVGAAAGAAAGVDVDGAGPEIEREDTIPRSMFRGPVELGPVVVECHVLSDGTRAVARTEMLRALGTGCPTGAADKSVRRIPAANDLMLTAPAVLFRGPGDTDTIDGLDAGVLVELCQHVASAGRAGLLKKKQMQLAATADAIVRACGRDGLIHLIDVATGYSKVRGRQILQLRMQATIADEMDEWVPMIPAEFWAQLARLEGIPVVPQHLPIGWVSYVMAFVYDAVEPDVGRESRREDGRPQFAPDLHRWLTAVGRKRLGPRMHQVIVAMNNCADIDEFRTTFAKVLLKGPLHMRMLGQPV